MKSFAKGDRVTQPQYGPGTITDTNTYHTMIDFDHHGLHMFVTNLVQLERTSEPAPVRQRPARRAKRPAAVKVSSPPDSTRLP